MLENYECVKYQQDGNYILYQYDNIEIVEISVSFQDELNKYSVSITYHYGVNINSIKV